MQLNGQLGLSGRLWGLCFFVLPASRKQAEAEKAAALKKKEEISKFLNQLAGDVKVAQQESKAASEALRQVHEYVLTNNVWS